MNIAEMFLFQKVFPHTQLNADNVHEDTNGSVFQHMLDGLFGRNDEEADELLHAFGLMGQQVNVEQLNNVAELMPKNEQIEGREPNLMGYADISEMLLNIYHHTSSSVDASSHTVTDELVETVIEKQVPEQIQAQLLSLSTEVEDVLNQLHNNGNLAEAASKLVNLLERWSALSTRLTNENHRSSQVAIKLEDPELESLWRNLLTVYERRSAFNQKNQYSEAKFDQKDVMKWLQHALNNERVSRSVVEETASRGMVNERASRGVQLQNNSHIHTGMPMSRVEQYVIYIQQSEGSHAPPVDEQLIDKFHQALRTSRFLAMNSGPSQMLFTLKPDNLGEMMVRLTEVNGEMTAKIIVTSETARKALQSNIHQLKNMFSPHQIAIERQDELTTQQVQDEQEPSSKHKEEEQKSFEHDEENEETKENQEEHISFHEILNEKV